MDASALMAVIRGETGAKTIADILPWAVVSAVNQAEVQTKLVSAGMEQDSAWWHIAEMDCLAIPFDADQARIAGSLVQVTRPYGLSLGDRCCLALAMQRKARVYTTDRIWKGLDLGIEVVVIR